MSDFKFVLNTSAVKTQILQSPEMLALTEQYAQKEAGPDTHLKPFIGFDRAKTIIYPNTKENPG